MTQPDRYVGHRLLDLRALGRDAVEIVCRACGTDRTYAVGDLIERFGNPVLPALIGLLTPVCPRRGKPDQIACGAVFKRPLTPAEEVAIKAGRMGS